jgi:hypothetical protein
MWQFARLAVRPNDSDPWTVNIAIPDMQLFSLPQTTENKAEMEPITSLDGFESMVRLLNTFALRLNASPISVSVPISVRRGVVGTVGVRWIYGV